MVPGYGSPTPLVEVGAPAGMVIALPFTVVADDGLALSIVIAPRQIFTLAGEITGAAGVEFTVAVAEAEQPVAVIVPVTVYVVFNCGLATTVGPVVVFNPLAGDHAYVFEFPVAVNVTGPHWLLGPTEMVGSGFTVTVTVEDAELQGPETFVTV